LYRWVTLVAQCQVHTWSWRSLRPFMERRTSRELLNLSGHEYVLLYGAS
jgi:hypothetical protein